MSSQKIAVIGSGISGLSAAWLLSKNHQVTLYEADAHFGGHANTVDVNTPDGVIPVDTGFIVFNEDNYPNLTALFEHLGVDSHLTEMSFGMSLRDGAYEYCSSGANGFFGQRRNFARPRHWQLLRDMGRFFKSAPQQVATYPDDISLGAFLTLEGYGKTFAEEYIVPMGAAIWSTSMSEMLAFPARTFIDFYHNHGLLDYAGHPLWRSVIGGSRTYVQELIADGGFEILSNTPVNKVVRHPNYVHIADERGALRPFDQVVIATHADVALKLLDTPDSLEADLLSQFSYQRNIAVLHRDKRWMPQRKRVWSSWNYLKRGQGAESELCITYWMNELQELKTKTDLFVTLNPFSPIDPEQVEAVFDYDHPVFDYNTASAQKELWALQGTNRTWFCGSYFGYGFHEDGIQSGLAVAEALGGAQRPWKLDNPSGRIASAPAHTHIEAAE